MWNLLPFSLFLLGFVLNVHNVSKNILVVHPSFAKEISPSVQNSNFSAPIVTITPTNTTTPIPTVTPTPMPNPTVTNSPILRLRITEVTDIQNYLLQAINQYRSSKGLFQVSMNSQTCDF